MCVNAAQSVSGSVQSKNQNTNDSLAEFGKESCKIIILTNKSVVVSMRNPEPAMFELETRPSQNEFDSETETFKK